MFELLTGERPFKGTAVERLWAQLNTPLPPLRSYSPAVPIEVEQILRRLTAKSPHDRYQSAEELITALEPFGASTVATPQLLRRPGDAGRTRLRLALSMGLIAGAAIVGVNSWSKWKRPDSPDSLGVQPSPSARVFEPVLVNSLGMKFVLVASGAFTMGLSAAEADALRKTPGTKVQYRELEAEQPAHHVVISRAYYLGQCEVTVGQFKRFVEATGYQTEAEQSTRGGYGWDADAQQGRMASNFTWRNVGWPQSDNHPVVNVTWNDAVQFCSWLTREEQAVYRLPTEAEWEHACIDATSSDAGLAAQGRNQALAVAANVADRSLLALDKQSRVEPWDDGFPFTAPVASFSPSRHGLYDMLGNVWEWCNDWYAPSYTDGSETDPLGPAEGQKRVARGGSWSSSAWEARTKCRAGSGIPESRGFGIGFRVVRELNAESAP